MMLRRGRWMPRGFLLLAISSFAVATRGGAQALPTASGPGMGTWAGGTVSLYQADYGQRRLAGGTVFVDNNLTWRLGIESEARFLRVHQDNGVHESTYLIGPKVSMRSESLRPYVKMLVGRGHLTFPFNYGAGSYFVLAPGGGVDYRVHHDGRLSIRLIDFEYQMWPQFSYGELHPYGASFGISYQVLRPRTGPPVR